IHLDVPALVAEFVRDGLCSSQCPHGRTGDDEIGLHLTPGQALAHHGRVLPAAIVEGPLVIRQGGIVSTGLCVPHEEQGLHGPPTPRNARADATRKLIALIVQPILPSRTRRDLRRPCRGVPPNPDTLVTPTVRWPPLDFPHGLQNLASR